MINAWSLLHDVLNGKLDEEYPIMNKKDTKVTPLESDEYDPITTLGGESSDTITFTSDGVGAADTLNINLGDYGKDVVTFGVDTTPADSDTLNFGTPFPGGMGEDHINFSGLREHNMMIRSIMPVQLILLLILWDHLQNLNLI